MNKQCHLKMLSCITFRKIKNISLCLMMAALVANLMGLLSKIWTSRKVEEHSYRESKYKLPYPKTPHLVLGNDVIKDRKILIIGDVHGCLEELKELLEEAKSRCADQEILPVFVGDLLSKGPFPVETVRKLQTMDHFAVRGNHDEAVLRQALLYKSTENYELPKKYEWVPKLSEKDITYLQELPYTISIPSINVIIVHAGLIPGVDLFKQNLTNMIIMRNIVKSPNGSLTPAELTNEGEAWASLWPGPDHVYFGHDAIRRLQEHAHATGLDTGCVYGNELTGALVSKDRREFIHIKAKKVYKQPDI
ncbi:bis(5'-nucleosyl)-tetraphosphatase PrpE [asymmetrical]-like [Saccostrea cucullata]|uniref:bis(5'-nucleosyl)-tetraphosphatase PrpE [asymmetrical]-like n=1 Tax=Saccostrea cuccullata TaxID=36930 RepID=UPI002ED56E99